MIEYRLLDESLVVPVCLHAGAIPLARLPELAVQTPSEAEFGLEPGVLTRALRAMSQVYGATGWAAIADGCVVGFLRFAPRELRTLLGHPCVQDRPYACNVAMAAHTNLPAPDELHPRALQIECMQIMSAFMSQGIGKTLLHKTLEWAEMHGWEEIYSEAVQPIFPIMAWSGHLSVTAYKQAGFEVVDQQMEPGIKEAVVSQRLGYHGADIQRLWETEYAGISDEEATMWYTVRRVL